MEGEGLFVDAAGFSPDVINNPAFATFVKDGKVDVGNVAKSYLGSQELIGRKGLILPKDENDEEGWNRVFEGLGRPKTADEYKLPELSELNAPEGFPLNAETVKSFKSWAHKLGLNAKQTAGLFSEFMNSQFAEYNGYLKAREDGKTAADKELRTKYGRAYEQNVANARKLIKTFADKEDFQFLDEGLGNDPRAIRLFAKIASKMGEDGILGTPKGLTPSPEEAKLEISKINNDKEHPYWKADHIEHAAAVKRMSTLQELAQGT